ncbi:MAG: hypothetical protein AW09_002643 [Candidatus Accumulibacter phosphatis]|uniref:Uncharacterized protein n=1 Tax=Candidatus Accumulibacter phosphatis TaxID=327160 RepID=A0A080LWJ7_9PROT|nr:MAG: hypothetical protein AW09_002643 [Candidatus Accumulibacter phosphatis]
MRLFEAVGAGLNRKAASDFRHRRQQWQTAAGLGDGFIGDADGTALDQIGTLRGIGCEMQVGVENLALAQHRALASLWLLDLDDHFGTGKDLRSAGRDERTGFLVDLVGGANAFAGAGFDGHLMAMGDHFPNR